MARHYGIPYMGSKQKLVDKIVPFILKRHPGVDSFYDLFGGGGSVSLYAVRKYPNIRVHYNELSTAIGDLMQRLKDGGDIPFKFVKRSEFDAKRKGDDWYAGLLQSCWSFGNKTGTTYLYGRNIQDLKHELHKAVVDGENNHAKLITMAEAILKKDYGIEVPVRIFIDPKRYTTPYQRRIVCARQIPRVGDLQHLSRIDRLVQIAKMPGISTLGISAGMSYDKVPIIGERPIIYCDPPYEGTAEYREGAFDHKAFYDWCMVQAVPVYVSSYKISDKRFKLVKAINTRSNLAKIKVGGTRIYNYENVYWNGVE